MPQFKTRGDFSRVIAEFAASDAGSYAFRYPIDTKGRASLASYFSFNLFEFCEVLDALLPVLDSAAWGAREALEAEYEAAAEARQAELEDGDWEP